MALIFALHVLVNVFIFDIFHLQALQYKIIFYGNLMLVISFFVLKNDEEPLSFLADNSAAIKDHTQIKAGFYFCVLCFSLWFFLYEEFIAQVHFNSFSGIAVCAFSISLGRLITKGASEYELEERQVYQVVCNKLLHTVSLIYFFGSLVGIGIFTYGEWILRWEM